MVHYIRRLIEQGEHQQLDFKFEISDSRKIARTLSAFANTDGGTLLVGVKDNGVIAGVRSEEEIHMVEAAAQMYCKPRIKFQTKEWEIEGKTVLEVYIPPEENGPVYAQSENGKWLAYLRVEDQSLLANKVLLRVWKGENRKKGINIKYTDKEKILLNHLREKETITMSAFSKLAKISRYKAENILVNFILLDIIDIVFTEKQIYYKLAEENA